MPIEVAAYAGLSAGAFLSATLLPGYSEAALLALLAAGTGDSAMLVLAATAGNSPGPVVGWILGHFLARFRDRRWFPVDTRSFEQATAWYARYGVWTLLFAGYRWSATR
jgi:membrane protein YqaA with SNARE-associated domain